MLTKKEIRAKMLKKRGEMTKEQVKTLSKIIEEKVLSLKEIQNKQNFFIYNSFKNEVETSGIISALKKSGKTVSCPLVNGETMLAVVPTCSDYFEDKFGVKTPKNYVLAQNIEVAIIPLVACDKRKNRIGFGKGYYDKFLNDKTILKIGVCYNYQVVEKIENSAFDVPLDIIITETQIIK